MKRVKHLWGIVLGVLVSNAIFADTVSDSIGEANDWLTGTLGPVVLVLGICLSGYYILIGNREAVKKGVFAIVGGLIITAAEDIQELIMSWVN